MADSIKKPSKLQNYINKYPNQSTNTPKWNWWKETPNKIQGLHCKIFTHVYTKKIQQKKKGIDTWFGKIWQIVQSLQTYHDKIKLNLQKSETIINQTKQ